MFGSNYPRAKNEQMINQTIARYQITSKLSAGAEGRQRRILCDEKKAEAQRDEGGPAKEA